MLLIRLAIILTQPKKNITQLNLSSNFGDYTGSFVLYNQSADRWNIYNMDHASTRVSPNSTYKIYDALLGLESGIITPEHSTFTWNGEPYPFSFMGSRSRFNLKEHFYRQ